MTTETMYERIINQAGTLSSSGVLEVLEEMEKKIEDREEQVLAEKVIVHDVGFNQAIDECIEVVKQIKDRGVGNTSRLYLEEIIQSLEALKK